MRSQDRQRLVVACGGENEAFAGARPGAKGSVAQIVPGELDFQLTGNLERAMGIEPTTFSSGSYLHINEIKYLGVKTGPGPSREP
jgi:hypothetical protein